MKENHLEDACLDWLASVGRMVVEGETVAPGGDLAARERWPEVVLAPRLKEAVARLNPALSPAEADAVVAKVAGYGHQSLVDGNREIYDWVRNGVPLERTAADGRREVLRVSVIDFEGHNDLLAVRQFTVQGAKLRRPDIVLFVNGLPLVVIELKNPADLNADHVAAWNQIQNYKVEIPLLFWFNLLNVVSDGTVARYRSLSAELSRYSRWRLLDGRKVGKEQLELEVATLRSGGLVLDMHTANREVHHWLDQVANRRTHGTVQARPCDLLVHERQHLQPLPDAVVTRVLPPPPSARVLPFPSIQHPLSVYGELMEVMA